MNYFSRKATESSAIEIKDLLPEILRKMERLQQDSPQLIVAAWFEIVGEKWASMTKNVSFKDGILNVKVKNSLALSLLSQHEKQKFLKELKGKFPSVLIQDIRFSIG